MKPIACIVLPTYNESQNISVLLPRIFGQAEKIKSHELHVLVVDDNSPDETAGVVRQSMERWKGLHLITGEKKGLGDAYKRGMTYAIDELNADLIFEMDADLQHDPDLIPLFIDLNNHGFSLVIGSRFLPGAEMPNMSRYRKSISLVGNWLIRFFGGLPRLRDLTSGYRCIQASLISKCSFENLSTTGYAFQTSLIFELLRNGARVIEVPMSFPNRKFGESKLSFPDQIEFLVNLLKIRFRGSYEFVRFVIIGSIGIVVNMGMYILLTRLLSLAIEPSAVLAIEASILFNFILHNTDMFRSNIISHKLYKMLASYHRSVGVGAVANFGVLVLLVHAFGVYDLAANLVGIIIGIALNYFVEAFLTWS